MSNIFLTGVQQIIQIFDQYLRVAKKNVFDRLGGNLLLSPRTFEFHEIFHLFK